MIRDYPITLSDVKRSLKICGSDLATLAGKTPWTKPNAKHAPEKITILNRNLQYNQNIELCVDIFTICGVYFLHTISKNLQFWTFQCVHNPFHVALLHCIQSVVKSYHIKSTTFSTTSCNTLNHHTQNHNDQCNDERSTSDKERSYIAYDNQRRGDEFIDITAQREINEHPNTTNTEEDKTANKHLAEEANLIENNDKSVNSISFSANTTPAPHHSYNLT